ncbi:FAD-dependent oxidoreductase [Patescibacteria group bacterium]|nr:FAD-dependent oxidoreductase [Patescibacteria group bacterium]MBU1931209.1 FAD-dependent oxidoreductase [Patescibacteria group bacterium]
MEKTTKNRSVLILGGGLCGLSAGVELSRKGWQITVLESESEVGGLARTFIKNGFHFDTGPHRWFTKIDFVDKWMNRIFAKDLVKVKRLTRIYFDQQFFYYPMRLENLRRLGVFKAVYILFDYLIHRLKTIIKPMAVQSMEDAYVEQFGPALYKTFFQRYSEKLWGRSCKELTGDFVIQRSRRMSLTTIVKDLIFKSKGKVVSLVDSFRHPKQGIGWFSQKMALLIKQNGGRVIVNSRVVALKRRAGKIISVVVQEKGRQKIYQADQIISTIPLPDLVLGLKPALVSSVLKAARQLEFRAEAQVTLFVNRTKIFPDNWIYVHPKHLSFVRFMLMDNWAPGMCPKGKTALVFELACNQGDEVWQAKDNELINLVKNQFIQEFGPLAGIAEKDIINGFVKRLTHEYPVYLPGYKEQLKTIKQVLGKITNLQIAGRNGIFRYNNMDHSIAMGLYAAWNLTGGNYDIEAVNIEEEYHEEKKP